MPRGYRYTPIEETKQTTVHEKSRWRSQTTWAIFTIVLSLTSGIIGATIPYRSQRIKPYDGPDCGWNPMQARAKGCHYEPMLRSWIPDDCYTLEPSEEYYPFDDRPWFLDRNLTIPMTDDDLHLMRTGEQIVGYTDTFHHEHCLYAWRKLHLAVEKRLPLIDSKTASLAHSTHCAQRMAKLLYNVGYWGYNETLYHTSSAPIMFQTCVPLYLQQ